MAGCLESASRHSKQVWFSSTTMLVVYWFPLTHGRTHSEGNTSTLQVIAEILQPHITHSIYIATAEKH